MLVPALGPPPVVLAPPAAPPPAGLPAPGLPAIAALIPPAALPPELLPLAALPAAPGLGGSLTVQPARAISGQHKLARRAGRREPRRERAR
jgi:hypothetical protein